MGKRLLEGIQSKIEQRDYYFTLHAGERLIERHISVREIEEAISSDSAEVIEDYPEDLRSPSCLILGITEAGRPLHIQCTCSPNVAVVTAYEPKPEEWIEWRVRKGGKA